jgi:ABC transport system ATP-binding/permease protein
VMICDKVAFMAKGGYLAFFGPPEEALTYFDTKDFDEIYLRLEEKSGDEWGRLFEVHTRRQGNAARPVRNVRSQSGSSMSMRETKPSRNPIKQFITLTSRSLETLMRSPKDIATLLALSPFLGALNFLIWKRQTFSLTLGDSNDALTMFFMLSIVTLLVGSLGSVREIVKEGAIYKREHMVCIQVIPYIASKVFIGMLFALYSGAMLFFFQIISVDFSYLTAAEFAQLFVPVFLATFSGVMLGLLVSAISPSEERAMLLIIAVIIPQFLLSGAMVPINDMGGAGPFITGPATAKWSWGSMLTTAQAKTGVCDVGSFDPPREPDMKDCKIPGINGPEMKTVQDKVSLVRSLDRYGNVFDVNLVQYWGAMTGIILVVLVLVVIVQKRKDAD